MRTRSALAAMALAGALGLSGCVQTVGPQATPSAPQSSSPSTPPTDSSPAPTIATAPQGAASIAYIAGGEVWLAAADGSSARQLTHDGAETSYHDPAQAPDGTIFALRGSNMLHAFDRTGQPVRNPVQLAVLENGADGLAVSPDGTHLAFVTTGWGTEVDPRFGTPTGMFIYGGTDVATVDGASVPGAAMGSMLYPSWLGNAMLALSDGVDIYVDAVGAQPSKWIGISDGCLIELDCPPGQEPMANFARAVVNRTGTMLAYQYQPYFGTAGRRFSTVDAPPPAAPTVRCTIEGQENYSDPGSFLADGRQFAFDDTVFDPESLETKIGQGIWVMTVDLAATDCGLSTARLIGPGGAQPDWGPAGP